uniref:Uncharacterized protein n=1 Tax=Steinernema glaseri TaxID=37863 RepID=A0A1I8A658_9BILA
MNLEALTGNSTARKRVTPNAPRKPSLPTSSPPATWRNVATSRSTRPARAQRTIEGGETVRLVKTFHAAASRRGATSAANVNIIVSEAVCYSLKEHEKNQMRLLKLDIDIP